MIKKTQFRSKLLESFKITKNLWLSDVQHLILYEHLANNYGGCPVFYDTAKVCDGIVGFIFNAVFASAFRNQYHFCF